MAQHWNRTRSLLEHLARRLPGTRGRELLLAACWPRIAGASLASRATARLAGDDVVIEVDDPRWSAELRGLAGLLRGRLEAELGPLGKLRFRSAPYTKPAASTRGAGAGPPREQAEPLPAGLGSAAARIGDPELRARFELLAARSLARGSRGGP